jgi:hypothetical protein
MNMGSEKVIDIIYDLYCLKCEYSQECSSDSPEYLINCRYIEEWALKHYNAHKGEG